MSDSSTAPPRSYWVISGLALLWNLVGVLAYVSQVTMSPEALQQLPDVQRALIEDTPAWAISAFAIATTAGVVGCVLLIIRNAWAVPMFLISLAAVLVQMYHAFVIANAVQLLGPTAALQPALVIAISCGLIWYSRYAKEKGWFR
jgi:hypothetical protein